MDIAQSNTQTGNIVADKLVIRQCLITKNGAAFRAEGADPILIDDDLKVTGKSTFCDDITVNGAITTAGSTPIKATDLPLTISTPGHYFLSDDIVFDASPGDIAINITSPNVCLDFHCHKLSQLVPADPSTQPPFVVGIWVQPGATCVTIKGCKGTICNFSLAGIVGGDLFGRSPGDLTGLCISGMVVKDCFKLASRELRPSASETFGIPYRPDFPFEGGGILLTAMYFVGTSGVTLRDVHCLNNFYLGLVLEGGFNTTLDSVRVDGTWSDDSGSLTGPESIFDAALVSGGSGYAPGDFLSVDFGSDGFIEVDAVAAGVITDFGVVAGGSGYTAGLATTTAATGSGTGATFTLTVGYESLIPWGLTLAFIDNVRLSNSTVNGTILRGDFTQYLNPASTEGGGASFGLTGLSLLGCLNVAVDNCEFSESESQFHAGTNVILGGPISVSNCKVNECVNVTFDDCNFNQCRGMDQLWGFFAGGVTSQLTLRNCTSNFHFNRNDTAQPAPVLQLLDAWAGFYIILCFNVVLENCIVDEAGCVGPLSEFSRNAAFRFPVPFEGYTLRNCKAMTPFNINGGQSIGYSFESFGTPSLSHTVENCIVSNAKSEPLILAGHFYDSGKTYPENAVVHDGSDNYISLIDGNTGNTPSTSPGAWVLGTTGKVIAGGNGPALQKIVQGIATGFYTGNFSGPRGPPFAGSTFKNCIAHGCNNGAESVTMDTNLFPGVPLTFYSAGFSVQPFDEPGGSGFDDKITFDGCTAKDCLSGIMLGDSELCIVKNCQITGCPTGIRNINVNNLGADPKTNSFCKNHLLDCAVNAVGPTATECDGVTLIHSNDLPMVITEPGCYKLAEDLVFDPAEDLVVDPAEPGIAIDIQADNVSLDIDCYKLSQTKSGDPTQTPFCIGIRVGVNVKCATICGSGKICNFSQAGIVAGDIDARDPSDNSGLCLKGITVDNCGRLASLEVRPLASETLGIPYRPDFPIEMGGVFILSEFGGPPTDGIKMQGVNITNNFYLGCVFAGCNNIDIDDCHVDGTWSDDSGSLTGPEAIFDATLVSGGSGYAPGDMLSVDGGVNGFIEVEAVAAGAITDFGVVAGGSGYSAGLATTTADTGSGTGATFTLTVGYENISPSGMVWVGLSNVNMKNSTVNSTFYDAEFTLSQNPDSNYYINPGDGSPSATGLRVDFAPSKNLVITGCDFNNTTSTFAAQGARFFMPVGAVVISTSSSNVTLVDCHFNDCYNLGAINAFRFASGNGALTMRNCTSNGHTVDNGKALPAPLMAQSDMMEPYFIIVTRSLVMDNCVTVNCAVKGPNDDFSRCHGFYMPLAIKNFTMRNCVATELECRNGGSVSGFGIYSFGSTADGHLLENCTANNNSVSEFTERVGNEWDATRTYSENMVVQRRFDPICTAVVNFIGSGPPVSIPVVSTLGFPPSGVITLFADIPAFGGVEEIEMEYTSITATSFDGCVWFDAPVAASTIPGDTIVGAYTGVNYISLVDGNIGNDPGVALAPNWALGTTGNFVPQDGRELKLAAGFGSGFGVYNYFGPRDSETGNVTFKKCEAIFNFGAESPEIQTFLGPRTFHSAGFDIMPATFGPPFFDFDNHVLIENCTSKDNTSGIAMRNVDKCNINDCVIVNNNKYGIWFRDSCTRNTVRNCYLSGNTKAGLVDENPTSSTVVINNDASCNGSADITNFSVCWPGTEPVDKGDTLALPTTAEKYYNLSTKPNPRPETFVVDTAGATVDGLLSQVVTVTNVAFGDVPDIVDVNTGLALAKVADGTGGSGEISTIDTSAASVDSITGRVITITNVAFGDVTDIADVDTGLALAKVADGTAGTGEVSTVDTTGATPTGLSTLVVTVTNAVNGDVTDIADVSTGLALAKVADGTAGTPEISTVDTTGAVPDDFTNTVFTVTNAANGDVTDIADVDATGAGKLTSVAKTADGTAGTPEVNTINATGATPAGLDGTHFCVSSPTTNYYVWYTTDLSNADPKPLAKVGIRVDISTGDSDIDIARKTAAALDANADFVAPGLFGNYFVLSSTTVDYYVWYDVDGSNVDPAVPAKTGIKVDITSEDSALDIARATASALDAEGDFVAPGPAGTHFTLSSPTVDYYVWYNLDGGSGDPAPSGKTGIQVDIESGDGEVAIANKTKEALVASLVFSVVMNGTYFCIDAPGTPYYVWYDIDDSNADPAPGGKTAIEVDIASGDSATAIAQKTAEILNLVGGLNATFSATMAASTYFTCSSPGQDYYVWYNLDNMSTDPLVAGRVGLEVGVASGDSDVDIANKTSTVLKAVDDFDSYVFANTKIVAYTVDNGDVTDAADVSTGFAISVDTQGA